MDRVSVQRERPAPGTLWIRPQGHPDEHAADHVAARVAAGAPSGPAFTAVGSPGAREIAAPVLARDVALEAGAPLAPALRAELDGRFSFDLATVRIHADARAARAASLVGARAYTVGRDIVFGANEYAPNTAEGRRTLLHELAHVAQQQSATADAVHLHRLAGGAAPKGALLKTALEKKDDDPVRDLVASDEWKTTVLEPWQAAWLIIFLLIGYTGDDDERAGLEIIENVRHNHRLDLALHTLRLEGRWEQLFDDYNGSEYYDLIQVLAWGIETLEFRAAFLDKFIDDWFVNKREETAIAMLLTLAPDAELSPLLDRKKREAELRKAIDNTEPRRTFEGRVGRKNELRFTAGATKVETELAAQAKASPEAKRRTPDEIKALLADAPKDLAEELKDYKDRLQVELAKPQPNWDTVTALNARFIAGLDTIEARKKAEFELELRYNVRFNIYRRDKSEKDPDKWGQVWTEADLKQMDALLKSLPPGILSSSTELERFQRGTENQDAAGSGTGRRVSLFGSGGLSPRVLAHELGHTISFTDSSKMQNAFEKQFKWERPAAKDIPADVKQKLDKFSEKEIDGKGARVKDGDWFYRRDRYSKGYLRHPTDACFISDYAATDRFDDFADSFEEYVVDAKNLKKKCPDKYAFIHAEVFVKYFLEKQGEKVLADWDEAASNAIDKVSFSARIATRVAPGYVTPLRAELAKALKAGVDTLYGEAAKGNVAPLPLKGTEAEKLAAPFRGKLANLYALLAPLDVAEKAARAAFDAVAFTPKKAQQDAYEHLGWALRQRMMTELAALWTPLADRVVKGERVAAAELKGVDQVVAKYVAAAPRVPSFLTEYLPVFKVREDIFASDVKAAKAKTKEDAILDRILQGKPKSAGKVSRQPAAEATTSDTGGERRRDPAQLVPGGGRPLRRDTRAMMEARMGRDFGGVRVHDDAEAAASADALQADAYTVGRDMVFAEGKNAPETPEGRELLGHELAHVAQQGAAGPTAPAGAPGAAGPREDRLPVVLEEPVTIPDTIPVEKPKDESPAMPPAPGEREAPHPAAPVVALSRSAGAGATLADVVPADHPSEREAAAIGRRVAGRDGGHHDLVGETAGGPVHRQPAAGAPVKQRLDLVFFMGHRDKPGNPFYANARAYFKTHVKTDLTIDNDKYRSLAGVFAYLRSFDPARPIGNIYLVSHANEDGTLSFPLEPGDADRRTSYGELKAAVKDRPELFALPFGLIDRQTVVHIKGCNIGRSTEMLNKLDESFGGRGLVTAPTHKQSYGTEKVGRTPAVRYEALSTYFLEYSGPTTKTRAEQLAEFKARYPQIPDKRWATLLPRAGAKRDVVAFKFSYANAADVGEALAKARAFGEDNFTRPEVYVWRVVSKKKTKTGVNVDLVAEKTNYTIAGVIEDENRKRLVPDESDPRYFGKSTYAPTPTAAALRLEPAKMTTPALMGRISEIDAELAAPQALADEGRKKEAEFEQRTMQAELGRRKIAVDVKVVKTEDWLGADEVYVRASRGGMAVKTGVHKLNDGQQRVYTVPLLSFLPLDAPIRFEVYDEDWPDKDDLIVRMDWRPPYAPLQNSESYDKADYRVNVRFER